MDQRDKSKEKICLSTGSVDISENNVENSRDRNTRRSTMLDNKTHLVDDTQISEEGLQSCHILSLQKPQQNTESLRVWGECL